MVAELTNLTQVRRALIKAAAMLARARYERDIAHSQLRREAAEAREVQLTSVVEQLNSERIILD